MSESIEKKVRAWMTQHVDEYVDECNEYDCTKLAEDAAQEFDLYEDNDTFTIPEWVFDLAVEVTQE